MKARMIQIALAATIAVLALSGALFAAGPIGQDFSKATWASGWDSAFDAVSIDGSWNLDNGWLGVCWYGNPPDGDAILQKDWTRQLGDIGAYSVNLVMSGHGWHRMYNVDYIDYSLDGGGWTRLASGTLNDYATTSIAGDVAVGASVQSLSVRYGVVDAGDWIQLTGGSCGITAVSATFVPEPSSIIALLSGCGGLMGLALRRRS